VIALATRLECTVWERSATDMAFVMLVCAPDAPAAAASPKSRADGSSHKRGCGSWFPFSIFSVKEEKEDDQDENSGDAEDDRSSALSVPLMSCMKSEATQSCIAVLC